MNRSAFIMALVLALLGLSACDKIPGTTENTAAKGKEAAAALLKDPSSAQFRNVEVIEGAVCGEINGKNGFGAYAGFTRFVWDGEKATLETGDDDMGGQIAYLKASNDHCYPKHIRDAVASSEASS